jgi:cystathionine gamma-synthase
VVAPDVMYYGTRDWLKRLESLGRIRLTLFDPRADGALEGALQ